MPGTKKALQEILLRETSILHLTGHMFHQSANLVIDVFRMLKGTKNSTNCVLRPRAASLISRISRRNSIRECQTGSSINTTKTCTVRMVRKG